MVQFLLQPWLYHNDAYQILMASTKMCDAVFKLYHLSGLNFSPLLFWHEPTFWDVGLIHCFVLVDTPCQAQDYF